MNSPTLASTIRFHAITPDDRARYEECLAHSKKQNCEFSFANLYLWGRQSIAFLHGHALFFSQFDRRSVYPYPVGDGDKKIVIDAIIADAKARGIPCRITGMSDEEIEELNTLYPNRFRFHCDEGAFDYVYDIHDLADLKGKKYHGKRNHLNRFQQLTPNYRAEPLSAQNLPLAEELAKEWYRLRTEEDPDADFHMEKAALRRALRDYDAIGMCGLLLIDGDKALALTLGSLITEEMMDVHFEKALPQVDGAYAAINYEFARYVREKYPTVRFLNREEDMGLEGLRKAKQSYHPHHMIRKCWACLLEDGYDY